MSHSRTITTSYLDALKPRPDLGYFLVPTTQNLQARPLKLDDFSDHDNIDKFYGHTRTFLDQMYDEKKRKLISPWSANCITPKGYSALKEVHFDNESERIHHHVEIRMERNDFTLDLATQDSTSPFMSAWMSTCIALRNRSFYFRKLPHYALEWEDIGLEGLKKYLEVDDEAPVLEIGRVLALRLGLTECASMKENKWSSRNTGQDITLTVNSQRSKEEFHEQLYINIIPFLEGASSLSAEIQELWNLALSVSGPNYFKNERLKRNHLKRYYEFNLDGHNRAAC